MSLMEISRRHDIVIFNDVERAVLEKETEKREVRAGDSAHRNELGHHLAGQVLCQVRSNGRSLLNFANITNKITYDRIK